MDFQTIQVRTWFLAFAGSQPRPTLEPPQGFTFGVWEPSPEEYLQAYKAVGSEWGWSARLRWNQDQLLSYLSDPGVHLWHVSLEKRLFGFIELDSRLKGSNEIAYLGLINPMVGKGLGTDLMRVALKHAWDHNPGRIWVHTCALDHKAALPFYQREGFSIEKSLLMEELYPKDFLLSRGIRARQIVEEGFTS